MSTAPEVFPSFSELKHPFEWRNYATSVIVHGVVIAIACVIPVAIIHKPTAPSVERPLYVQIPLKPYQPAVKPPQLRVPRQIVKLDMPQIPAPEIKRPLIEPRPLPKPVVPEPPASRPPASQVAAVTPAKIEPAPARAPTPKIQTGVFAEAEARTRIQPSKDVKLGGFGDPNGSHPAADGKAPSLVAKVGSFDMAQGPDGGTAGHGVATVVAHSGFDTAGSGTGARGGDGNARAGSVKTAGFGDAGSGTPGATGAARSVRSGGFGDIVAAAPPDPAQRAKATAATTPVQILYKPKPVYTEEARQLKVQGQVWLDVEFRASGQIQVLRVVRGLEHGLNEAAEAAAMKIKFRPATRDGAPVDTRATVNVTFELT